VVIATRFEHGGNIATVDLAGATSSLEIRMHRDARLGSALRFNIQENEVIVVSVDEV
jgi:hypothetical protein